MSDKKASELRIRLEKIDIEKNDIICNFIYVCARGILNSVLSFHPKHKNFGF